MLYLSLTKLCSAASFTRAPHYFTPSFTYVEKYNSFSLTQQKHYSWIYLDIAAFQDFKASFLLLPHAWEEFARLYHDRKVKKIISLIASLSFALQATLDVSSTDQGKINDNRFMSVEATQFFVWAEIQQIVWCRWIRAPADVCFVSLPYPNSQLANQKPSLMSWYPTISSHWPDIPRYHGYFQVK